MADKRPYPVSSILAVAAFLLLLIVPLAGVLSGGDVLSSFLSVPGIVAVAVSLALFLSSAYLSRGKGRIASGVAAGITGVMLFLLLAFALAAVLLVYAISGFRPV